jgi:hypothetical protein
MVTTEKPTGILCASKDNCVSCRFSSINEEGRIYTLQCGLWQREIMEYNNFHDYCCSDNREPIVPPSWCVLPVEVKRDDNASKE